MANVDVTRIAGNIGALNALNSLQTVNSKLAVHQARLASGKRLMEAADDPAGMSIATSFDVRRQGIATTLASIGDTKNLMSTAEGGLKKIQDILVQMRNKAMTAQGDTVGETERAAVETQLKKFRDEINDIVGQTRWNDIALLNSTTGSAAGATAIKNFLTDPAGATSTFGFEASTVSAGSAGYIQANQSFFATSSAVSTAGSTSYAGVGTQVGLGLFDGNLAVTNASATTAGLASGSAARLNTFTAIDKALDVVKQGIAQVGSFSARLTFKEEQLTVQQSNTEAAYNRIMNANMAEEQVEASKLLILQQTATAMLSQANSSPQFLLQLFQ
jgi:flagellin